jgi:hypothetical protein
MAINFPFKSQIAPIPHASCQYHWHAKTAVIEAEGAASMHNAVTTHFVTENHLKNTMSLT